MALAFNACSAAIKERQMARLFSTQHYVVVFFLVLLFGCAGSEEWGHTGWHEVIKGKFATVDVEGTLYEMPPQNTSFIHVRIRNVTDGEIGMDLRYPTEAIHEQGYGVVDRPGSLLYGGLFAGFNPLSERQRRLVIEDFKARRLTMVSSRSSHEYFIEGASADGRREIDQKRGRILYLRLDGRPVITNGQDVETIDQEMWTMGRIATPFPVKWGKIPPNQHVIRVWMQDVSRRPE
jgi:hypothetical protein